MSKKTSDPVKTFESALTYLRSHQFDVADVPGVANQVQVRKYGCGAVLAKTPNSGAAYVTRPGCLIGGEISLLVDRGYQKFLRTSKIEVAATAAHLHALHAFDEEMCEAIGTPDYYNLALGTISDLYLYDRLKGREATPKPAADTH
ncbi:MAG TPA: hypothetical protein VMF56_13335 [Acidobacteriaceae bacterium]|nr:hypothetical protein [Acidobacteriaceae bacterium]